MVTRVVTVFWAIVRIILGILQMTGAIVSATLLFRLGLARETIIAVVGTAFFTIISLVLFKWFKVQERALP
jgi:hypothetical protein